MLKALIAIVVLAVAATPASAEVVERTPDSFTLRFSVGLETTPGDVALALESIARWWDSNHTYSGDAANMTLSLAPGGCFCEALPGGDVFVHGRVKALDDEHLWLEAPLGPLRDRTTKADLIFSWPEANRGTAVTMTFTVEGAGMGAFADAVDGVMDTQFDRLTHFIAYGEPPAPDHDPA